MNPSWLQKVWHAWKTFARKLGDFNSRLILTLFYFVIVGVVSLLVGRWQNYLESRAPSRSNWFPVRSGKMDRSDAERQF